MEKAKVNQTNATALLITKQHLSDEILADEKSQNEAEKVKLCEELRLEALNVVQVAIRIAPWDIVGWSLLKIACKK